MTSNLRAHWPLDPALAFLNHGSFGATPIAVMAHQSELRARLERNPVDFFMRYLPGALDHARQALAAFLGADPDGLAFVPNATTGVNTVLANLAPTLGPGDELLTTDHAYGACRNALEALAARTGARVVIARVPFPGTTPDLVVDAIRAGLSPRTKLALVDHLTSPTGLVFPVARIVSLLAERGVDTLVDGAHAPGSVPLALDHLGAAYYTGNGHKWTCAPKGAAFLWVRADRRRAFHPLTISHGCARPLAPGESRFRAEFDWLGTDDPTPFLALPFAIDFVGGLMPGGWETIRATNRAGALAARSALEACLKLQATADPSMLAGLASIPLPDGDAPALATHLFTQHAIEIPVIPHPAPPARLLRVAWHLHTRQADLARLATALPRALATSG
jgi:isopenicillin-N epimerase